jgi:hypothetical protein
MITALQWGSHRDIFPKDDFLSQRSPFPEQKRVGWEVVSRHPYRSDVMVPIPALLLAPWEAAWSRMG